MVQNRHFVNGSGQATATSRRTHFAEAGATSFLGPRVIRMTDVSKRAPRHIVIGMILVLALLAFEVFNFDTTRYALRDLLGNVTFLRLEWAAILAIAFCAIDFAGLVRMFTADRSREMPKEVWYLMGAWLLGATMNAMMTWWAITLTLLNHNFGNEVLSREQLLYSVPIFVAVLVWLTRILFIGAFTVAGDKLFEWRDERDNMRPNQDAAPSPFRSATAAPGRPMSERRLVPAADGASLSDEVPDFLRTYQASATGRPVGSGMPGARQTTSQPVTTVVEPEPPAPPATAWPKRDNSRVRQRPPIPNGGGRAMPNGLQARGRNRY
jgi:hypothetical protein